MRANCFCGDKNTRHSGNYYNGIFCHWKPNESVDSSKFLIYFSLRHSCSFMSVGEQVGQLRSCPDLLDKRPVISKKALRRKGGVRNVSMQLFDWGRETSSEDSRDSLAFPQSFPFQETCCSSQEEHVRTSRVTGSINSLQSPSPMYYFEHPELFRRHYEHLSWRNFRIEDVPR